MTAHDLIDNTKKAAALAGMPAETFALAQMHYHGLCVSDPTDEMRAFRLSEMLEAAQVASAILQPQIADQDDDPDDEEHDDLPEPPDEDDAVPIVTDKRSVLDEILYRGKRAVEAVRG